MDGKPYQAGYHAATLRRHLWREHLGMIEAQELDASKDPNAQARHASAATTTTPARRSTSSWPTRSATTVWDKWTGQASTNTDTYRYLFRADPDDAIKTWKDYDTFVPRGTAPVKQGHLHDPYMPVEQVRKELDKIRGHLVWMPLDFLCEETMAEKGMQINSYTEVSRSSGTINFQVSLTDVPSQSVYT